MEGGGSELTEKYKIKYSKVDTASLEISQYKEVFLIFNKTEINFNLI